MVALPSSAWFMGRIMDDLNVFHIKTGNFMGVQNGIEVTPPWDPAGRNIRQRRFDGKKKNTFLYPGIGLSKPHVFWPELNWCTKFGHVHQSIHMGVPGSNHFGPTHLSVDWCKGNFTGIFRGTSVKSDDLWCSHFHTTWTMVSK